MTNGRFGLQRSSKLLVSPCSKYYTQRCQYWSTLLLWCTRYPPSLSGKILRRLQPHPDYCCSNVINCSQLCTHNQCNTINTIKTCSDFMPLWVLMTMMFVSIFAMLRCPDCAKVTWQRTVTGQASDTEMGAACDWRHALTHEPGIKYTCCNEQHQNVQCQYILLCKHCKHLHFHTSDTVLQFLHNPS